MPVMPSIGADEAKQFLDAEAREFDTEAGVWKNLGKTNRETLIDPARRAYEQIAGGNPLTTTEVQWRDQRGLTDLNTPLTPEQQAQFERFAADINKGQARVKQTGIGILGAIGGGALAFGGGAGGATAGAAEGAAGGAAGGTGLTIPAGAGEVLGVGGGAGLPLGSGITPGVASTGIGGGALGTGIAPGVVGGIGALGALEFSPAAMQALQTGGQAVPGVGGGGAAPASGGATGGNAAGGLRVGASASRSLGLPTSGGLPSASGITVPPAGGAPATGAAATQTGVAAGAQPTFVDSIISQLKNNALGLGIAGAGLMMSGKQTPLPNEAELNALGAESAGVARELIGQYRSGTLSQGQQASLDQQVQHAKNQITNYFASIGQADSTAHMQALQQVDQTSLQIKQQMLDTALQQGLQAIGVAQGPLNTVAQYQLGQDRQLADAFGRFSGAVGTMMGQQAGSVPGATASATPNIMGQ